MIGQEKLVTKLKSYSITSLPHSMLFVGEVGCGKHTLVHELEKYFNISTIDVTDSLTYEMIEEIKLSVNNYFYIMDMNKVTERQQNIILKFLEEPTTNAFLILLTTSKSILLDTIINRCMTFEFEPYSQDELMQFLPFEREIEILVKYCHTPGQVLSMSVEKIKSLVELCDNIINKIGKSRFPNILRISQKTSKEDFNLDIFYNVLLERLEEYFIDTQNDVYSDMYNITSEALKKHNDSRLNQEMLVDSLVIDLHEVSRGRIE